MPKLRRLVLAWLGRTGTGTTIEQPCTSTTIGSRLPPYELPL